MRLIPLLLAAVVWVLSPVGATAPAGDANRLTYLDEDNPFHPTLDTARLITPQWVGEPGVDAVVILAVDDLRDPPRYEAFLRPLADRLKRIDGRSPISIFCNACDPNHPLFPKWLAEGISLEVHTIAHPCPCLAKGNFQAAWDTFANGIDLLAQIPGNHPVAFRMPCCDSINSTSPRFFAEILTRPNGQGRFLTVDSSVMNIPTEDDTTLPPSLTRDAAGKPRFAKYLPAQTNAVTRTSLASFATTIRNYPYPYVIDHLCWEFPPIVPSDWEAMNLHGPTNIITTEDWKAALDITVLKQGVMPMIFHPHGWSRIDQLVELVDHAAARYGTRVKFLTFPEALQRLNKNLLANTPLRNDAGGDNGVRLVDLNHDGFMDVLIGNNRSRLTRVYRPDNQTWAEAPLPVAITRPGTGTPDPGVRLGVVGPAGDAILLHLGSERGAWRFTNSSPGWTADDRLLQGLDLDGKPVTAEVQGTDRGVRLRDFDHDSSCELIVANPDQSAVFEWNETPGRWTRRAYNLPANVRFVDAQGHDNGLRFADINKDGFDDVLFSNPAAFSLHLFVPKLYLGFQPGWTREVLAADRGIGDEIPMIVRGGDHPNNGAWFHSEHLWVQNEDTASMPGLVDGRSFQDLLAGLKPPPLAPEAALASFRLHPGFSIKQIAHEPLVKDPVCFDWSADGRLWVVEMGDYPLGIDGQGTRGGVVRTLVDTNHDGVYDTSTVFLDGINFPNGIVAWRKGVIISAAPDIFYAEDTDGDGRADVRRVLFSGFIEGNQQHRANIADADFNLWIHGANGDSGGSIRTIGRVDGSAGSSMPTAGGPVTISGHDFRFNPETGEFQTVEGQTQFGRRRDDWGEWFGNNNSTWGWHWFLPERYLARNPFLAVKTTLRHFAQYPNATRVFHSSRSMQRFNDVGMQNYVTSACSPTPYRDSLFGPEFESCIFVCEPVYNAVHCEILTPDNASFSSHRATGESETEFLMSSDNWFRPVFTRTGPDGALYVADMYRLVIEHPEWIPADVQKHIDLRAGADMGRIYRVAPTTAPAARPVPALPTMDTTALVAALDTPNGWQRDTVQRLLWERKDPAAVPGLSRLAESAANPKTRLHALYLLQGLNALKPGTLLSALESTEPRLRKQALILSERFLRIPPTADARNARPDEIASLTQAIQARAADADPRVRFQLALSLGEWNSPAASTTLARLAMAFPDDSPLHQAILTSALPHAGSMLAELLAGQAAGQTAPAALVEQLLGLAARSGDHASITNALAAIINTPSDHPTRIQFEVLAGLLEAVDRLERNPPKGARTGSLHVADVLKRSAPLLEKARSTAVDTASAPETRVAAIRLLGRNPNVKDQQQDRAVLADLLAPNQPGEVQQAALSNLASGRVPGAAGAMLTGWPSHSPLVRATILDAILLRSETTSELLAALEQGSLAPGDVNQASQLRLLNHPKNELRQRAAKLFKPKQSDRQALVDSYHDASALKADADRGSSLFAKNCSPCHRVQNQGNTVGPDLAALTDRSVPAMLIAILDPNRVVEDKFLAYTASTRDGRDLSGIVTSETGTTVTLRQAGGTEETLLRRDILEFSGSRLSLMPEGLEASLDHQAIADVVAYLNANSAPPKTLAGNTPQTVKPSSNGRLQLKANVAEIYGDSLVLEEKYENLGFWMSPNDRAVWSLQIPGNGDFDLWADFALPQEGDGNRCQIEINGQRLAAAFQTTGSWDTYGQIKLGTLHLAAGPARLAIRAITPTHGALVDLKELRLMPSGSPPPEEYANVLGRPR